MDRSIETPGDFIQTDVLRRVRAVRGGAPARRAALPAGLDRRGLRRGPRGRRDRGLAAHAAQPLRRQQGRRRPAGLRLLGDLRPAGGGDALLQQLRAVPVPGEAGAAVRDQRHRGPAAAGLRHGPEPARLDPRRGPLRGARHAAGAARRGGGDVQHRRRQRAGRAHHRRTRSCGLLGKPGSLVRHVEDRPGHDRRYALDSSKLTRLTGWQPAVAVRRRASGRRSSGIARTRRGGAPSRRASSAPTTSASTGSARC